MIAAADTKASLPESAQRVADHLRTLGYEKNIMMLPTTNKTSAEAAIGLGYPVVEVAKSIIFHHAGDDVPALVITSGANRVDEAKVSAHMGAPAEAGAKFVREKTEYAIDGVCPAGHAVKPVMLLDQGLFQYDSLWATAGYPHAVFSLMPAELEAMTGALVANIIQRD